MVAFCLFFIGSDSIELLSYYYTTMAYKFTRLELCGKAPVRLMKPFMLILKGKMVAHNSCVFNEYMSG